MSSNIDFYQVSLKLILKNPQGQILALKAHENGSFAGFYDLPGGRINEDEFNTPISDLIKREVREELGTNIKYDLFPQPVSVGRHSLLKKINDKQIRVFYIFFLGRYFDGDIQVSHEHLNFDWFKIDNHNASTYFTSGILEGIDSYLNSY